MSEESSMGAAESQPTASAPARGPEDLPPPSQPLWRRRTTIIAAAAVLLAAAGAAVAVRLTSQSPQSQDHAVLANPCVMVSPATLAKYLPGATSTGPLPRIGPPSSGVPDSGGCSWQAPGGYLTVIATIYGSATGQYGAQQGFDSTVHANSRGGSADRPVPGLGDQATAIFRTIAPGPLYDTELYVRSGDALIMVGLGTSKPGDAAALSRATAIARDVLANLAKAPPPGQEPRYAGDFDPCHILRAAVPRYLPGATQDPSQPSTTRQLFDTCSWSTPGSARTLLARADIYGFVTGPQGAEQAFNSDVRSNPGVTGQQPVTGLGDQAVAVFGVNGSSHTVLLLVWSSNAEVQVSYTSSPYPPPPTRAAQLAAAIAIARDLPAGQLSA